MFTFDRSNNYTNKNAHIILRHDHVTSSDRSNRKLLYLGWLSATEATGRVHLVSHSFVQSFRKTVFTMADSELQNKLNRRNLINEGEEGAVLPSSNVFNPYTEFKEFSRKQIQDFQKTFNK